MERRLVINGAGFLIHKDTDLERLRWLRRVRWTAFLGHALVFFGATIWLGLLLDTAPFLLVEIILGLTNVLLYLGVSKKVAHKDSFLGAVVSFDVILFTYLLASYGGHANPFSMFYLVHVVLAALLISQFWSWVVTILSSACFASLFVWQGVSDLHSMHHTGVGEFDMHLNGMLGAFILIAILIAAFVTRMRSSIDRQELELLRLRASEDKLISLTTLAAGAAHELNTPLSTMSVILGDLRSSIRFNSKANIESDLNLLQQELERCSNILRKLSPSSGDLLGEMPRRFTLKELACSVIEALPQDISDKLSIDLDNPSDVVVLPLEALTHVISLLVKNAADSYELVSFDSLEKIILSLSIENSILIIEVKDRGPGIDSSILQRIGEPFFTTKEPGRGVGLGVFLCRMLVSRLGGELSYESISQIESENRGTSVKITIPVALNWNLAA